MVLMQKKFQSLYCAHVAYVSAQMQDHLARWSETE